MGEPQRASMTKWQPLPIVLIIMPDGHYCYSHFIAEKTDAQEKKDSRTLN